MLNFNTNDIPTSMPPEEKDKLVAAMKQIFPAKGTTMTNQEVMQLALEFIENHSKYWNGTGEHPQEISEALRSALSQQGEQQEGRCGYESCDCRGYCQRSAPAAQKVDIPTRAEVEFARLTGEIQRLAVSIWSSDFRSDSPHWTVLPDAFGALSQISNMVAGMERKAAPAAQPTEREALLLKEMRYIATISTGQVHRIAMMTLEKVKDAPAAQPIMETYIKDHKTPLTDEQIVTAMENLGRYSYGPYEEGFLEGARFAEQHHGIGVDK